VSSFAPGVRRPESWLQWFRWLQFSSPASDCLRRPRPQPETTVASGASLQDPLPKRTRDGLVRARVHHHCPGLKGRGLVRHHRSGFNDSHGPGANAASSKELTVPTDRSVNRKQRSQLSAVRDQLPHLRSPHTIPHYHHPRRAEARLATCMGVGPWVSRFWHFGDDLVSSRSDCSGLLRWQRDRLGCASWQLSRRRIDCCFRQ
jgi:hypothetical protein